MTTSTSPDELDGYAWNVMQLVALGFEPYQAKWLAGRGVDWHDAEHLIDKGCSLELAMEILV